MAPSIDLHRLNCRIWCVCVYVVKIIIVRNEITSVCMYVLYNTMNYSIKNDLIEINNNHGNPIEIIHSFIEAIGQILFVVITFPLN